MKNFLSMCMLILLIACGSQQKSQPQPQLQPQPQSQLSVSRFRLPDTPTIAGIYDTPAGEYVGIFEHKSNCGENHGGKGSHDIKGIIEFKDNGQFVMIFSTNQAGSLVYQQKREGYWRLVDSTYITMAVAHELNSNIEITVINPKASLKVFFKIDNNKAQYMDEYQRRLDFRIKRPGGKKLQNLNRI